MKKTSLSILGGLLMVFGAASAFACPDAPTGPYYLLGATVYGYDQSQPCWYNYTGSTSTTTLSCATQRDGWSFGVGTSNIERTSFTIGSSDPIANANNWTLGFYVDLISPYQTSFDSFQVTAIVVHPNNNGSDYYPLFSWNGSQGDMTCGTVGVGPFSADHGDTVTIEFKGVNYGGGATEKVSVPLISNIS